MSAHSVVSQAIKDTKALRINTSAPRQAAAILDALKAAGYAVIELPKPDSERYEGDEHEHQDRKSWVVNDVFDVMVWNRLEVQIAEGIGLGWETREPISAEIARQLGAALLAAADFAEVTS